MLSLPKHIPSNRSTYILSPKSANLVLISSVVISLGTPDTIEVSLSKLLLVRTTGAYSINTYVLSYDHHSVNLCK